MHSLDGPLASLHSPERRPFPAFPSQLCRRDLEGIYPALFVLLVASFLLSSCASGPWNSFACSGVQPGICPDRGCTIFYAADDHVALAGNNEDWSNPYTFVWFVPPEEGKYGRVYFGFEDGFPQGGVNEKGLFIDGSSLPNKRLSHPSDKPAYNGNIPPGDLTDKIMSECATVSEALAILGSFSHVGMDTYQLLIGDASGDSLIVDGYTILRKQGSFQIATNFRLSENPAPPYPCWRYTTALDRLSNADSFTVELFRDILNATHQELPRIPTLYSTIFDLKNGLIYLYYYHDFENVVVIDVAAELAKGFHYRSLASLFPSNAEAANYQLQRQRAYETEIPGRATPTGKVQYTDYAGDYRVGEMGETLGIYIEAERLYLRQDFSLPIELLPEAVPFVKVKDKFFHIFSDGSEMNLYFQRDEQGAVSGAMGALYGVPFDLRRLETARQPVQPPTPVVASPEVAVSPTAVPAPVTDDSVRAIPWWGWGLAALAVIAIAAVVRLTIKR